MLKQKNIFFLLLMVLSIAAFAQNDLINRLSTITDIAKSNPGRALKSLDSLRNSKNNFSIRQKIKIQQAYSECNYYKGKYNEAISYLKKAISLSKNIQDSITLGKLYNNIGIMQMRANEFKSSIEYYDSSLIIKKQINDTSSLSATYMNMANVYNKEGYNTTATKFYLLALKGFESSGNKRALAITLLNLGTNQQNGKEYDKALLNLRKAYKMLSDVKSEEGQLTALNDIGTIQIEKGEYENAEKTFYILLNKTQETHDSLTMAFAYINLGQIAISKNQWGNAGNYLKKAIPLFRQFNYEDKYVEAKGLLAVVLFHTGKPQIAKKMFKTTFDKSKALKVRPIALLLGNLYAKSLQCADNYKLSNYFLTQVHQLQSEMYNSQELLIAKDIQAKYHFEKQQKEILLGKQKRKLLEAKNASQQAEFRLYLFMFIVLIVIAAGIILFYINNNRKKAKLQAHKEQLNKVQLENISLKNESLENELTSKKRELSQFALHISAKNKFLQDIGKELRSANNAEQYKQIYMRIMQNMQSDKANEVFYDEVNQFLSEFRYSLKKNYKQLTKKDIQLCSLIKLGLSSKDIAAMQNIDSKSVDMQRYRLRKKLEISSDISIESWLDSVDSAHP